MIAKTIHNEGKPDMNDTQEPQGAIPLPKEGFARSRTRSASRIRSGGISAEMRDFFSAAWEQHQKANPDACITDTSLVRVLRLSWYDHLENNGYNRNTASVVAGDWYKVASRHTPYIRNEDVLKHRPFPKYEKGEPEAKQLQIGKGGYAINDVNIDKSDKETVLGITKGTWKKIGNVLFWVVAISLVAALSILVLAILMAVANGKRSR